MSRVTRVTRYAVLRTRLGRLLLAARGGRLVLVGFADAPGGARPRAGWVRDPAALREAARQLLDYLAGRRRRFRLPLALEGTPFQQRVWRALLRIPYGARLSYGALARRLGRPGAARAVGAANGRNPLAIVVPCHRLVGGDGDLAGYGGGLQVKRALLALERGGRSRGGPAPAPAVTRRRGD